MKARIDGGGSADAHYQDMIKGYAIQTRCAKELHQLAGVREGPCGIREIKQFQEALPGYQIKVMSITPPHMIIYVGPTPSEKIIRLIKDGDHYDGCSSFNGFMSKSYFCDECNRGFDQDNFHHHPCLGKWCPSCKRDNCSDYKTAKQPLEVGKFPKATESCRLCHRKFFGDTCYNAHLQKRSKNIRSVCDTYKKCPECCHEYENEVGSRKRPKVHECGQGECPYCEKEVDLQTHQCYIQRIKKKEDEPKYKKMDISKVNGRTYFIDEVDGRAWVEREPPLQVYCDFEATTDIKGNQKPILVCLESDEDEDVYFFYGPDCTTDMFEHLESLAVDQHGDDREVIAIFHNLKGYDGMFILQHCYDTHREVTDQITVGTKILSLKSDRLTFKDSLCFLPFPLASFPATFGIRELYKGFFPHKFNTIANQRYVGPMPPSEMYDPDRMSAKKKGEFERWYQEKVDTNYVFDMRREMEAYCESDVKLLKAGCQNFQQEFKRHADFDPMEKCVTIASACNRFWRKKMVPKNTIAIQPPQGWIGAESNQSVKAKKWLAWCEYQLRQKNANITQDRIQSVRNGGEKKIGNWFVDGYDECDPVTRRPTVYEFNGCLWHGCLSCYPTHRTSHPIAKSDRSLQELYEHTQKKLAELKRLGYNVVVMWECQWDTQVKNKTYLQAFLDTFEDVEPLEPRDAFFGGRTNAVKLHHIAQNGEQIKYVDVTSLYPWVNKNKTYPVGHPEIHVNPENQDVNNYFGVMKADILPPYNLYHPVLPYRCQGKLTIPLCRSCVEDEMSKGLLEKSHHCCHTPEQRMLRGTWCTPEIQKAVSVGYKVLKVHEVWNFPEKQQKVGLFRDYVNTWLKIKQESAGYPVWALTPEQKSTYINQYKFREGISLTPSLIAKNPGRKATAKLMLNSFWGKFGENLHEAQTTAVYEAYHLFNLVSNNLLDIKQVRISNQDTLEVVHTKKKDNQPDNGRVNIFVAAFTTCHARLKLYESLEQLQERVLYFDTDSIIYTTKPGEPDIPLGDYLGDMTNELDDGDFITEFTSAGPKNYGYKTYQGKVCCKVCGFSLNVRGANQLNYDVMKQNLIDEITNPREDGQQRNVEVVNPNFFYRDPANKDLKVISQTKRYGLVFDKRVVDPNTFKSYPYGYTKSEQ